ncbi:DNA cytosine methyltransferase [Micromonospora taraxaci]|uniref:DNA cytosine methyltransferase n=1 Tax=Micromonospora taraxaci TaxID=1316803 RepID=UPI0033EF3CAA
MALDFFCGAGGLTRGLKDVGIRVLAGIDNDYRLKDTYEHNNKPSRFMCEDVTRLDILQLRSDVGVRSDDVVIYAACTPCQPFSTLNQRRGIDERKQLLLAFGELVLKAPPDYIIVENVPGLHNAYGREIYSRFLEILEETGFHHRDGSQLDASDYGVPQVRKRFIMVASRHAPISLPKPRRGPKATVRSAIGDYPPPHIGIGKAKSRSAPSASLPEQAAEGLPPNHIARKLHDHHRKLIEAVPADGGSRADIHDESLLLECHKRTPKLHRDVFGRMAWDAPAPTLTCRCTDVYCGRFAHPQEHRGLSLREAARLQTFGDDYEFHGTFFHAATQIGNAVPVLLASRLGRSVLAADRQHRNEGVT